MKHLVISSFLLLACASVFAWKNAKLERSDIPKCAARKLPKADARSEIDAEWHEADDKTWLTNMLLACASVFAWEDVELEFADIPKCAAWKLPKADARSEIDAEWHEAGDGTWFTNSVGEKISVESYCAALSCTAERSNVSLLDKHYARCFPNAIQKLHEDELESLDEPFWTKYYTLDKNGNLLKGNMESQQELTAWRIEGNVCLVLWADDFARMRMRMYEFKLFDGVTSRTIAKFDYLPDPDRVNAILSVWSNPDAVNNVAAMYGNNEAWTHSVDDDYVIRLLTLAARFGSATACKNLATLGKARGWSKARTERLLFFAEACRDAADAGHAPKMELKDIAEWPKAWIPDCVKANRPRRKK